MIPRADSKFYALTFLSILSVSSVGVWYWVHAVIQDRVQANEVSIFVAVCMFAVMGWLPTIPMLCQAVRLQWEWGEKFVSEVQETFLTQDIVDEKLSELAKQLETKRQVRVKLKGESMEQEIAQIASAIQAAKDAFWKAHGIAKSHGYKVMPRVTDYHKLPVQHDVGVGLSI